MRKKFIFLFVGLFSLALVSCGKVEVETVEINGPTTGHVGEEINLTVKVLPEDADDKSVKWSSSSDELATVNDGKVSLLKEGSVTITAKSGKITNTHEIVIFEEVITESIEITGLTTGKVGEKITLTANVLPADATNKKVTWMTTNSTLATVSNGVVTLLEEGEVEIIAQQGSITKSHIINIRPQVVLTESITLSGDAEGEVGEFIELIAEVLPLNATNREVMWESSDESLATVSDGKVNLLKVGTVTIRAYQGEIEVTKEITIIEAAIVADSLIVEADTNEGIVGDKINILARVQPTNATYHDVTWSSSDESIATVSDGVITLVGVGNVTITAHQRDVNEGYKIRVYDDLDFIFRQFTQNRKRTVSMQTITHYGATEANVNSFPSIFPYRFNDDLVIDRTYMLPDVHFAHPNKTSPIEWIVIHDTGNIGVDAKGNARFIDNESANTRAVSWQYTVGNDGVFQTLEDDQVGNHGDSGTTVASFIDTGIPAVNPGERTRLTIIDGYFAIKGIKTDVKAPGDKFVDLGIWPVIIDGRYFIPKTTYRKPWENSTTEYVGLDGSSTSGIGIETSVFSSADIWITWSRTAKLVAHLLLKHDMKLDRIVYHNNFNNKVCPQTAIRSGNLEAWYEMMKFEYMVLKQFADYNFELIPHNTNFLDDTGRVIGNPKANNFFDYTLKITDPSGKVKEQTFRTTVA